MPTYLLPRFAALASAGALLLHAGMGHAEGIAKSSTTSGSAATATAVGQRVFVCAHSFMIYTAKLLPPMAQAAGIAHVNAGQQMIGGSKVIQHWELPDDKNRAKEALRSGNVDVITLSPHMLMPDPGITNFTKLGLEKNPKLRVLVQASWPARDGHPEKGFKNEERDALTLDGLNQMRIDHQTLWRSKLEDQVRSLNTAAGHDAVHIIPVSDAVFALREQVIKGTAPGIAKQSALFRDPLGHPLEVLATLVTYTHFAAIYQCSPEGLAVPEQLKNQPQAEELNRLLQKLAWEAVVNYPMSGVKQKAVSTTQKG
ncbi:hypothetical protein DES53_1097 [Roseimicrobium gellanilyticum]|uniref:Uncharacterized protein n=1 Tax=Roseimicrobium gellanilyticum TaxID=748857 RepID=A0A366HC82_9BACT|nr:hypothetical protein [Roseimicrobium gellanilyticum]RBP39580.1 hypothetical protein DES53_1097 [Roseimicrobium gellanilyticum]